MTYLNLKNIKFKSNEKIILDDINLSLQKGDYLSIVGSSGSGKSTLLRIIGDFISPSSGERKFDNKSYMDYDPIDLKKDIIYCFQSPFMLKGSVLDNLSYPYLVREEEIDLEKIKFYLEKFNLSLDYLDKDSKSLSGGEAQRVALIRAILTNPKVLLLDEVTSSLDPDNTTLVENILYDLNKEGITILSITHDMEQSKRHANKLIELKDGKILNKEVLK